MTLNKFHDRDGYEIWLDPEDCARTGLCVGCGATEADAWRDAAAGIANVLSAIHRAEAKEKARRS